MNPGAAVLLAGGTAGRAVVFAGSTVVVSIFSLVLMGRDYLWGVAVATSLAVTVVVLASVTLLPALLGFAGRTIDRFRLPWFRHDVDGLRAVVAVEPGDAAAAARGRSRRPRRAAGARRRGDRHALRHA